MKDATKADLFCTAGMQRTKILRTRDGGHTDTTLRRLQPGRVVGQRRAARRAIECPSWSARWLICPRDCSLPTDGCLVGRRIVFVAGSAHIMASTSHLLSRCPLAQRRSLRSLTLRRRRGHRLPTKTCSSSLCPLAAAPLRRSSCRSRGNLSSRGRRGSRRSGARAGSLGTPPPLASSSRDPWWPEALLAAVWAGCGPGRWRSPAAAAAGAGGLHDCVLLRVYQLHRTHCLAVSSVLPRWPAGPCGHS